MFVHSLENHFSKEILKDIFLCVCHALIDRIFHTVSSTSLRQSFCYKRAIANKQATQNIMFVMKLDNFDHLQKQLISLL